MPVVVEHGARRGADPEQVGVVAGCPLDVGLADGMSRGQLELRRVRRDRAPGQPGPQLVRRDRVGAGRTPGSGGAATRAGQASKASDWSSGEPPAVEYVDQGADRHQSHAPRRGRGWGWSSRGSRRPGAARARPARSSRPGCAPGCRRRRGRRPPCRAPAPRATRRRPSFAASRASKASGWRSALRTGSVVVGGQGHHRRVAVAEEHQLDVAGERVDVGEPDVERRPGAGDAGSGACSSGRCTRRSAPAGDARGRQPAGHGRAAPAGVDVTSAVTTVPSASSRPRTTGTGPSRSSTSPVARAGTRVADEDARPSRAIRSNVWRRTCRIVRSSSPGRPPSYSGGGTSSDSGTWWTPASTIARARPGAVGPARRARASRSRGRGPCGERPDGG